MYASKANRLDNEKGQQKKKKAEDTQRDPEERPSPSNEYYLLPHLSCDAAPKNRRVVD